MELTIGKTTIDVDIDEEVQSLSPHTGATLRHLEISFSARERDHDYVMRLLSEARKNGATSSNEDGTSSRWTLSNSSYSYSDNSSVRHYTWKLDEGEELRIETLILDTLELTPYQYEEEFDNDILTIKARVTPTSEELERLHEMMRGQKVGEYFPVTRKGIGSEPRLMRFGRGIWSQEGDTIKYELILIDQAYDERTSREGRGPLQRLHISPLNVQSLLAKKASVLDELMEMLVAKGLLTDDDMKQIKQIAEEREWQIALEFDRVRSLDEWEM